MTTPPGWHPDPQPPQPGQPTQERWWDGQQWTEHVQPAVAPDAATETGWTPDGARLASWGRRVTAYLIDVLLISAVSLSLSWHWLSNYIGDAIDRIDRLNETARAGDTIPSPFAGTFDSWSNLLVIGGVGIAIFVVYHAAFLRFGHGASLGKKVVGIRVRLRERDGQLSWSAIGQRLVVQLVPSFGALVPLFGSVVGIFGWVDGLWPLWDAKNQAIHDKWPGTNVVHK